MALLCHPSRESTFAIDLRGVDRTHEADEVMPWKIVRDVTDPPGGLSAYVAVFPVLGFQHGVPAALVGPADGGAGVVVLAELLEQAFLLEVKVVRAERAFGVREALPGVHFALALTGVGEAPSEAAGAISESPVVWVGLGKVQFADASDAIALIPQALVVCPGRAGQVRVVAQRAEPARMQPGGQGDAGRGADGAVGEAPPHQHAARGEAVEVRRADKLVAGGADAVRPMLVGHDEQYVGSVGKLGQDCLLMKQMALELASPTIASAGTRCKA